MTRTIAFPATQRPGNVRSLANRKARSEAEGLPFLHSQKKQRMKPGMMLRILVVLVLIVKYPFVRSIIFSVPILPSQLHRCENAFIGERGEAAGVERGSAPHKSGAASGRRGACGRIPKSVRQAPEMGGERCGLEREDQGLCFVFSGIAGGAAAATALHRPAWQFVHAAITA